jgi:hypothetical protein
VKAGALTARNSIASGAARVLQIVVLNLVVAVFRPAITLFLIICLGGCTSSLLLHPLADLEYGYRGGEDISIRVPKGWKHHSGNLGHAASFRPSECEGSECPLLKVEVFHLNPYQTRNEFAQALSYLDAVRRHDDSGVSMERAGSFVIGRMEHEVTVYRFHSNYVHERLMVFLFKDDLMAEIELTGGSYLKLQKMIDAMQSLAMSVRFSTDRR